MRRIQGEGTRRRWTGTGRRYEEDDRDAATNPVKTSKEYEENDKRKRYEMDKVSEGDEIRNRDAATDIVKKER